MLVGLLVAGCSTGAPSGAVPDQGPPETGERWITIDKDALDTAAEVLAARDPSARLDVREADDNIAVLRYNAEDFKQLSELMHERHTRCGGFIVHETLEEARAATRARDNERIASLVTYSIDNAATVNPLLTTLSQANILATIQHLSAYTTRYYTSATGVQASNWLRDQWTAMKGSRTDVTVQQFTHSWAQSSVIATITGTTFPNEVIIIGGHLDSIAPGDATAPGADDDASGIATLTEVYRNLMARDFRPQRTIKFMAYAAEEVGLRGSAAIASNYQTNGVNVVGVMQLDMTNYKGSSQDIWLMQDYTNAAQNAFVGQLITAYTNATWSTDSCGYGCSDHASWHNRGYAASMPFESAMDDYNPFIHTDGDTLEVSDNNASHAIKFAQLATAYAGELAKGTLGTPSNTAPNLTITAPATGGSFPQGTAITLSGTAVDTQDGTISNLIAWSSSRDGALGTGASRSVTLTAGAHTLTATVTDTGGLTSTKTVAITITSPTQTELFRDEFEGAANWTKTGLWHMVNNSTCATPGYSSPTHAMYFGIDGQCNYSNGARVQGTITSPTITGVSASSALRFKYFRGVERANGAYDVTSLEVLRGTAVVTVWSKSSTEASATTWQDSGSISLSQFAGQSIQLRFKFDSKDSQFNTFKGFLVDDVVVTQ